MAKTKRLTPTELLREERQRSTLNLLGLNDAINGAIQWLHTELGYHFGVSRLTEPHGGLFFHRFKDYTVVSYLEDHDRFKGILRMSHPEERALALGLELAYRERSKALDKLYPPTPTQGEPQ